MEAGGPSPKHVVWRGGAAAYTAQRLSRPQAWPDGIGPNACIALLARQESRRKRLACGRRAATTPAKPSPCARRSQVRKWRPNPNAKSRRGGGPKRKRLARPSSASMLRSRCNAPAVSCASGHNAMRRSPASMGSSPSLWEKSRRWAVAPGEWRATGGPNAPCPRSPRTGRRKSERGRVMRRREEDGWSPADFRRLLGPRIRRLTEFFNLWKDEGRRRSRGATSPSATATSTTTRPSVDERTQLFP